MRNTFVTSYSGFPIDREKFEERTGILSQENFSQELSELLRTATNGIIFRNIDGTSGYKGIFPR